MAFPSAIPVDEIKYLVDVLRGAEKAIDFPKAWRSVYAVIGFVSGKFLDDAGFATKAVEVKATKPSKKALADAIESLAQPADKVTPKLAGQNLAWLIPILIELGTKFLNRKKG